MVNLTDQEKLGIAGGLVIGEGSFTLQKWMVSNKPGAPKKFKLLVPRLGVSNTEEEVCQFMKEALGMGNIYPDRRKPPRKNQWKYRVDNHKPVKRAVNMLLPYLFGKKRKVALLLKEFIELREGMQGNPYQPRCWEIYDEMRELNRTGRR